MEAASLVILSTACLVEGIGIILLALSLKGKDKELEAMRATQSELVVRLQTASSQAALGQVIEEKEEVSAHTESLDDESLLQELNSELEGGTADE